MFLSNQEPLTFYRLHKNNFSRRYNLHAIELDHWIKNNRLKLKKEKLSVFNQKIYLYKLKIKKLIKYK